jgi:hypothetical protein
VGVECKYNTQHYETNMDYNKNMSTDREKGRGNRRARLTRGSRNPKHRKRKHYETASRFSK